MNPAEFRMEALKIATNILNGDTTGREAFEEGKRIAEDILEWCHEAGRAHVKEFTERTNTAALKKVEDEDFGEEEQAVFLLVRRSMPNGATSSSVATTLGFLHHRAQAYLKSLQSKGLIECRGRSRGARWFLKATHDGASDKELIDRFLNTQQGTGTA